MKRDLRPPGIVLPTFFLYNFMFRTFDLHLRAGA